MYNLRVQEFQTGSATVPVARFKIIRPFKETRDTSDGLETRRNWERNFDHLSVALLRKYYDSTMINVYSNLYLNDNFSLENFVVEKIDNWLKGRKLLPEYRVMSQYIRSSKKLSKITELLDKDKTYKEIRNRCNDHTHYNFYQTVLLNDKAHNILLLRLFKKHLTL